MAAQSRSASILAELRKFPTLDPRAVLAVAAQEGLGGGIGDNGTSFGPFQLHYGGAYPGFAPQGAQASQAWAWSPAGLDYALRQIAQVAGGLRGRPAVDNIVSRFERPANVPNEISGALGAYGQPLPSGAPSRPGRQNTGALWSLGAVRVPTASGSARRQAVAGGPTLAPPQPPQINPAALASLARIASQLNGMFRPQPLAQAPVLQPLPNMPAKPF